MRISQNKIKEKRMKYLLTITLAISSLTVAQDELPGWGVYLGGGLGSISMEKEIPGKTYGSEPALPFIGVSKGVMLGVPLVVSVGLGKRAFNEEMNLFTKWKNGFSWDYLDIAAYMPYPVGPGFAQVGFLYGNPLNSGTVSVSIDGGDPETSDMPDEIAESDPDYGLILAYGFPVTEQININAGYYLGLADQGDSEIGAMKFNGLFLFLGYNF